MALIWRRAWLARALAGLACLSATHGALYAAELPVGDAARLRWDNTLRYSTAFRLRSRDAALIADPNSDDGDRNFHPGVISNRVDLFSELDVGTGPLGFSASGAAWYDWIYHQANANDSPATFNPQSVPHDRFTRAVRRVEGGDVELLNAFFHDSFAVAGIPVSVRAGRHVLIWGESLFFAGNSIAAGQAPVDFVKQATIPSLPAKEVFRPVTQISASLQPSPGIGFEFYYQLEWRKSRLPGSGSYFSDVDFLDAGGERLIVGPGRYLLRDPDQRARASGQYGVALHIETAPLELGFYALRFNAKDPQVYQRPNAALAGAATFPASLAGTYDAVYPEGIEIYGASAAGAWGDQSLAGEISARRNMPLVGGALVVPAGTIADGRKHPLYPSGDTLHAQFSIISVLPPSAMWEGATLSAEIAANRRLDITRNGANLDRGRDTTALALRGVFEPQYFAVLPGLDLTPSLGFGLGLAGNSSTDPEQNAGAGDVELGLAMRYRTVWEGSIAFTHFYGSSGRQPFADRDFLAISLQRTF